MYEHEYVYVRVMKDVYQYVHRLVACLSEGGLGEIACSIALISNLLSRVQYKISNDMKRSLQQGGRDAKSARKQQSDGCSSSDDTTTCGDSNSDGSTTDDDDQPPR